MNKDTGGPAFPVKVSGPNRTEWTEQGMTLRDYFAAKAMQGVWSAGGNMSDMADHISEAAYMQADAMLKERIK